MKHWLIDYSVKYTDDRIEEISTEIETENIAQAFVIACEIVDDVNARMDVRDAVLWGIGIVEDDVFGEE